MRAVFFSFILAMSGLALAQSSPGSGTERPGSSGTMPADRDQTHRGGKQGKTHKDRPDKKMKGKGEHNQNNTEEGGGTGTGSGSGTGTGTGTGTPPETP